MSASKWEQLKQQAHEALGELERDMDTKKDREARHAHEMGAGPDLQAQAAVHDFEYTGALDAADAAKSGARSTAEEEADTARCAREGAVGALREGGESLEGAAGAAKERAEAAGEAGSGKAHDLKASAAQKLRSEKEGTMTATERASGRAHAEAEELTAKMQEAGGAVSERVHEAQVSAVHAMRETGAGIAEGLDTVATKAAGAVEAAKEKLGLGGK